MYQALSIDELLYSLRMAEGTNDSSLALCWFSCISSFNPRNCPQGIHSEEAETWRGYRRIHRAKDQCWWKLKPVYLTPKPNSILLAVLLSNFSRVRLFATPWAVAFQAPLSIGFSRQEYWSGLPCPPPGDLPHPEIEPASLTSPTLAGGFSTTSTHLQSPI